MKNYKVVFEGRQGLPVIVYFSKVVLKEYMVCVESDHPFKVVQFLRRGKEVACFYPEEFYNFRIVEVKV